MPDYNQLIISAIKESLPEAAEADLTPETQFHQIPSFDSMSVVNFQVCLSEDIGEKAFDITPIMEMRICDYAALLEE